MNPLLEPLLYAIAIIFFIWGLRILWRCYRPKRNWWDTTRLDPRKQKDREQDRFRSDGGK